MTPALDIQRAIDIISRFGQLRAEEAEAVMNQIMRGEATEAQIGAYLMGLRMKGETEAEILGSARAMRANAIKVPTRFDGDLLDTCGTGGDKSGTFNISTTVAFVAAGAGVRIAKHGNRAMASRCGSADVLEAAGVALHPEPERLLHLLETIGIVFLFAQAHHPAMRHVAPVRRELGIRTLFNQLGPLANPAGADAQLIGVYDPDLMAPMAEALALLGIRKALVVHGADGLDEISPCGPTSFVLVEGGELRRGEMGPSDFGLEPLAQEALAPGRDLEESVAILREAISDVGSPRCRAAIPGAAAALWLAGLAKDLAEAARLAQESVRRGTALRKLESLVEATQE